MNARRARSRLRPALDLLAAVLIVLAAGCGGEEEGADERAERTRSEQGTRTEQIPEERTPTERAPTERAPPEERGLRDFSRAVGGLCTGFYEDAGTLQARLQQLGVSADSPPTARRVALEIVGRIQARTARFLREVRRVPLPDGSPARENARRLVASTARFLGLQRASTAFIRRTVLGRSVDPSTQARVRRLQGQLMTELGKQRALVRELDIPECLSPTAGASG